MMHGIGSNASGYRNQLRGLADGYRPVAWDAPGYGGSDGFPYPAPSVSNYAHAAIGLLDALQIGRAHLIGSSLGALFAARIAAEYPARVGCVVLSAPATGFGCRTPAEAAAHVSGRINDIERLGATRLAEERAARLVAPGSSAEVLEVARELVASINVAGYSRAARVLGSANIFDDAPRVKAPTLILIGEFDGVTPLQDCAAPIHRAIRGSRLEIVEGIAHLVKLEAPDRFNALVSGFFAENT